MTKSMERLYYEREIYTEVFEQLCLEEESPHKTCWRSKDPCTEVLAVLQMMSEIEETIAEREPDPI